MDRDFTIANEKARAHGYDPTTYGNQLGGDYDQLYPSDALETDAAIQFLAELAEQRPGRSVLEFGIGTGRLGIELHRRGLEVAGIEASQRMIDALRQRAPDACIDVALGDYVTTRIARSFSVVTLVFNNILDVRGVPGQLALFENAARHLEPKGCFVIEAFVLNDDAKDGSWRVSPRYVGQNHVELQMARFDISTGMVERTLVHLLPEGPHFITVRDHYADPQALDVMAHVHGMVRIARYADWQRNPFTAHSRKHVSVYQRA